MDPKQLEELVKQLGPAVAAQIVEQAKGNREGFTALFGAGAEKKVERKKGQAFGQFAIAWLAAGGAKGIPSRDMMTAKLKSFGSDDLVKGLQESVFAAGGSAVPVEYSSEFIELLRPALVFTELGAQQTSYKSEKVIGRVDSGTTAYWVEEGVAPTKSTPATGRLVLKKHKLAVLADCSNDIIRNPAAGFDDANLTADMVAAARQEFENQSINGSGVSSKPKGLLTLMDSSQSFTKAGTTAANYIADIDKLVNTVDKTNRKRERRGFLMHPDVETALLGLRDTAGWVFRVDMIERGMLRGFSYKTSTLMPTTHLLHGEWADVIQGFDTDVTLSSTDALRFAEDETTFKLIMAGDVQLKRSKSFAAINNY
jgi:HK97 family phage major capsid protein